MTEQAFDDIIKNKLANHTASVPTDFWNKVYAQQNPSSDAAFDGFTKHALESFTAPIPTHIWDTISNAIVPEETKHFDAYVQDRLTDYIAPVPADMWDKVKPEEEEDKRRFFFLLPRAGMVAASILLLVLAGTVSAYLYYQRVGTKIVTTPTEQNKAQHIQKEDPNFSNNDASVVTTENEKVETNSSAVSTPLNEAFSLNSIPLTLGTSKKLETILVPTELDNTLSLFEENYSTQSRENGNYFFGNKKSPGLFGEKTIADNNHTSGIKNVVICPSDRKSMNPDWDLEVFAGPNYGMKSVSANTASAAYMARKDSSEKAGIGFTAGFNIVKPLNDRLLLKTGLQYTQVNEKFTYRTENEVRTTTVVSVRTIIRAPGDTVIVRDTSTLQQIGFKNNTVKNRYRSIDIPVVMGYRFGNDDLSIGINAGVIVNLSSWYQGVILDTSLTAVPITKTATENIYKNNIGLGLYGSISIAKKINYNTYIFAEPFVRYNLGNTTTNNAPYNQRFTIGGLAVGLRFNLNSR